MKFTTINADPGTVLINGRKKTPVLAWSIGVSTSGGVVSTSPIVLDDNTTHLHDYVVQLPDERVITKQTNLIGSGDYKSYDSLQDFKTNHRSNSLCQ